MSKSKLLIYPSLIVLIIATIIISLFFFETSQTQNKMDLTTLDPVLHDQSWLTDIPCGAPCWYGLEPGKTSREDAVATVSKLSFIDSSKLQENSVLTTFPCKHQAEHVCVKMSFNNGFLEFLWILPSYPITLEQAVEKLGNPDGYSAYPTDPGATGYRLDVIWKEKQLVLEYTEYKDDIPFWEQSLYEQIRNNNGKIPKNIFISDVLYTLPYHIENKMDHNMTNYKKWEGFAP